MLLTATTALVGVSLPCSLPTPLPRRRTEYAVPGYWRAAASWLGDRDGTTLLLPGSSFGDYYWGSTRDEPLQVLAGTPWAVRDAVPLASAGGIRLLDAIERRFVPGGRCRDWRTFLARAGVRYVAAQRPAHGRAREPPAGGAPGTGRLRSDPGGLLLPPAGSPIESAAVTLDERTRLPYPSIEVYRRGAGAAGRTGAGVATGVGERRTGGRASVTTATAAGATVVGSDRFGHERLLAWSDEVLTDGYQRREVAFGRTGDNTSPVLTADDPGRQHRGVGDYDSDPDPARTTRTWEGLAAVRASSSAADATASLRLGSGYGPQAALDGDPASRWVSGSYGSGVGEWLELRFTAARPVEQLSVTLARLTPAPAGRRRSGSTPTPDGHHQVDERSGSASAGRAGREHPAGPADRAVGRRHGRSGRRDRRADRAGTTGGHPAGGAIAA